MPSAKSASYQVSFFFVIMAVFFLIQKNNVFLPCFGGRREWGIVGNRIQDLALSLKFSGKFWEKFSRGGGNVLRIFPHFCAFFAHFFQFGHLAHFCAFLRIFPGFAHFYVNICWGFATFNTLALFLALFSPGV